jgi:hypothetical protein
MQTITHQEARSLIQYRADQALDMQRREALHAHLEDCAECADYANQIHDTETALRMSLRKQWNVSQPRLNIGAIQAKITSRHTVLEFMTTRSALVGVALLFFVFAYWQFGASRNDAYSPMLPVGVSAVPTPSLLLTGTQAEFVHCQMMRYKVQPTDTLEFIALHFSVSEVAILNLNHLEPGILRLPELLTVPICKATPTSTGDAPTFTNTPSLEPITYTPG